MQCCEILLTRMFDADTLNVTMFILFHWVETKRMWDMKFPGSQADGSFFGVTDEFKGKEPGYPGEQRRLACCSTAIEVLLHVLQVAGSSTPSEWPRAPCTSSTSRRRSPTGVWQ